jgi:phosphate-selective porin OprO/OprP
MVLKKTALILALATAFSPAGIWAQAPAQSDDRQAIEQEIQELRKRLEDLDQRLRASDANAAPKASPAPVPAQNLVEPTPAALPTPTQANVTADTTGFTIKSPDNNFSLKIGADLQVDTRTYTGAGSAAFTDGTLLRRVRPTFQGTVYKYVDYFFRPDFGQGTTVIYEAYAQFNYFPHINLRVGKFKPGVGMERLQSDDDTTFVERGLPTLLVPSRDIGFQIAGDARQKRVGYQVGVFNGVVDNSLSDAAVSDHRDYAARLFLTPFAPDKNVLKGLGFGFAATGGNVDGLGLPAFKSFGQNTFFTFASGITEAGHRTRLAPQAYYYLGPFGILVDGGLNEEGLQKGLVRRDIAFRAWQTQLSYILTGEAKGQTSPTPRHSFDPLNHGWGAVELAVRTGEFSADHTIFAYGFANPATTPRSAREWVGGVNWYLNRLVRISGDYGVTGFEGGLAGGNRLPERVLIFRFQLNFI